MDISPQIVGAAIAAIPPLLSPWFSSSFQQRGLTQKAKEAEVIEKRIQVIEQLLALGQHLSEEKKNILQAELANIVQDIVAERQREHAAVGTDVRILPWWNRYLLLYDQPTLRASVYRGIYWFFLFIGIFGAFSISVLSYESEDPDLPFAIIGALVYVVIGLFFRAAAVRQQKRAQALAMEKSEH